MFCPNCGTQLPDDARFCRACGIKLNTDLPAGPWYEDQPEEASDASPPDETGAPDADRPSRQRKILRRVILVVVLCAAAAAVCLFVLYGPLRLGFRAPEEEAVSAEETAFLPEEEERTEEAGAELGEAAGVEQEAASSPVEEALPIWEALDKDSVRELLGLFDYYYESSGKTEIAYEGLGEVDVYKRAAFAILMDQGPEAFADPVYYRFDGDLHTGDEIDRMTDEPITSAPYGLLPAETYEAYLRKMFGPDYSIEDFAWDDSGTLGLIVQQDSDGNFYLYIGDGDGYAPQFNGIVRTAYDPEAGENGAYAVLAVYVSGEEGDSYVNKYALFWIVPDEEAEYGCVVTGLTDAGDYVLDEAVERYMDSLESADAEESQ